MKYEIVGGKRLSGKVRASGNKNSVFPCVAAALLTQEEVILENISDIRDTEVLIQILKKLGIKIEKKGSTLSIQAQDIRHTTLPKDLMTKLRGSMVLVGAMLSRMGKVHFYYPGGDVIGRRSIETHLDGFKALGVSLKRQDLKFSLFYPDGLINKKEQSIFMKEASVTAVENLILASVLGQGVTILKNCPKEPHIVDLCKQLLQMGADIKGVGTDTLVIRGVDKLNGTKFKIGIDYIEVATYAVAGALTLGQVTITDLDNTDLDPLIVPLQSFGLRFEFDGSTVAVSADKLKSPLKLVTNIWPGFPTDLMSVAIVLATQAKGAILCHDWMYESRMFFVDKLISMGAKITLADPHRVLVYGPSKLRGRVLETPDIRAGMALLLASLVAKGKSTINQAELIERGYEDVVEKLRALGADIIRKDV